MRSPWEAVGCRLLREAPAAGRATAVPGAGVRLHSLTSLRAFAALAVFGVHAATWLPAPVRVLTHSGPVGVGFFFILSGFVLAWVARDGDTKRDFYRRRVARIVPAYLVATVLAIPVLALAGGLTTRSLTAIIPSVFLLQAWWPDPAVYYAGNGVAWSLSAEAAFYLAFPFLLGLLQRLGSRRLASVLIALAGLAALLPIPLRVLLPDPLREWAVNIAPPVRILEFAVGVALAILVRRGVLRPVRLGPAALVAAAAYVISCFFPGTLWRPLTLVPFALLLTAAAQSDITGRVTWLHRRWLIWLGECSYSFYLLHQLVIKALHAGFGDRAPGPRPVVPSILLFLAALVLAVVAAAALHIAVEKPMDVALRPRRRATPRPGEPAGRAAPVPSR